MDSGRGGAGGGARGGRGRKPTGLSKCLLSGTGPPSLLQELGRESIGPGALPGARHCSIFPSEFLP